MAAVGNDVQRVSIPMTTRSDFEGTDNPLNASLAEQQPTTDSTASSEWEVPDNEGNNNPPPTTKSFKFYKKKLIEYSWRYIEKFRGVQGKYPASMTPWFQIVVSSILGFIGILLIGVTDNYYLSEEVSAKNYGVQVLSGSFAATAVLLFDAYVSPFAQPRHLLGGFFVSSITGVTVRIVGDHIGMPFWVTGALALSLSIAVMNVTKTVHPPGGACALIAVIGGPMIHSLGYGYVATSMGGAFIMLAVGLLGNNLIPNRRYPQYWF